MDKPGTGSDRGIGTDRSRQIRQEIERIARFPLLESVLQEQKPIERERIKSSPRRRQAPGLVEKK